MVAVIYATVRLLTYFAFYDDEGYMLISLVHYVTEGHLYTKTFSEYGPFYFYAQGIFFQLLHLPITHDMGRLVTLIYWLASSALAMVFGYRLSGSPYLSCAAGLSIAFAGRVLANEPGHPQQIVLLLYIVSACLSALPLDKRHYYRLFLLGCVGAALAFTKVNIGVFYIAGLAAAVICLLPVGRIRSIGIGFILTYSLVAPWLLMHNNFQHGVGGYCLIATIGGFAAFICGVLLRPRDRLPMRAAVFAGAGVLGGAALIVAATLLQGMSLYTLVWGVVLKPLNHPNEFDFPMRITPRGVSGALVLTAATVALRLSQGRLITPGRLDALRCVAGTVAVFMSLNWQIRWVVPLLPLTLMPRRDREDDASSAFLRLFVTTMAATQFLEPYPVAGSQVQIAGAPMILWAFLCISEGIAGLRGTSRPVREVEQGFRLDAAIGSPILVVLAGLAMATVAKTPFPAAATGLRGAEWLHLPTQQAARFEAVVAVVRKNCSMLFTMPGMGSFNLWSGVPTPNGWNMPGWMAGIPAERQAEILGLLEAHPRACAILDRRIVRYRDRDRASVTALPLARYVMIDMPVVAKFGEYELHVHPGRNWRYPKD